MMVVFSGKTTFALSLLGEQHYVKDMVTDTFDEYRGENAIFCDEMNKKNGKHLLSRGKNLMNVNPQRFNVKFTTMVIYAEVPL